MAGNSPGGGRHFGFNDFRKALEIDNGMHTRSHQMCLNAMDKGKGNYKDKGNNDAKISCNDNSKKWAWQFLGHF